MSVSDMEIESWGEGSAFYVKAHAGARRDRVSGLYDGMLKVEVTTAPEKGKANKAIVKLLAKSFNLSVSDFALLSGQTNSRKRFGIRVLSPDNLREVLSSIL